MSIVPFLSEEIEYKDPLDYFAGFAHEKGAIFFDSADLSHPWSRYSFFAADPWKVQRVDFPSSWSDFGSLLDEAPNPFQELKKQLAPYALPFHPDFPPWQGGIAGFFSYDAGHFLERLCLPKKEVPAIGPALWVGFYDVVVSFDHLKKKAWIISTGLSTDFPSCEEQRFQRAQERLGWIGERLAAMPPLSPLTPLEPLGEWHCNFTEEAYKGAVQKVIDYIYAGDIFQANLSRRFEKVRPSSVTPFEIYRHLRLRNPAPFSGFFHGGDFRIASSSPERFLKVNEAGQVETCPIKGTCKRSHNPQEDQALAEQLASSSKDQAENIMIVDLLRNDLSRVCEPHSVQTPTLLELQSFATVHHLVSTVTGTLFPSFNALDLLQAAFPGGSITGAPKIRAMEIIAECEQSPRGPYCGSLVYMSFHGAMDSNILIRTLAFQGEEGEHVSFQAGGGITAGSNPSAEYAETTHKAAALLETLPS